MWGSANWVESSNHVSEPKSSTKAYPLHREHSRTRPDELATLCVLSSDFEPFIEKEAFGRRLELKKVLCMITDGI